MSEHETAVQTILNFQILHFYINLFDLIQTLIIYFHQILYDILLCNDAICHI